MKFNNNSKIVFRKKKFDVIFRKAYIIAALQKVKKIWDELMVYYSQLIGKPIIDSSQKKVGIVRDFCFADGVRYASVTGIVCLINGIPKRIKWDYVSELGDKPEDPFPLGIYLNREIGKIKFVEVQKPLLKDILDKQIIDVSGARVVRVNDVLLGKIGRKLAIIGVDVSTKGLLRRVGISKVFKPLHEHIILWKDVAPLSNEIKNLQLKTKRERINEMHPAEIADIIRDLSIEDKVMVFNTLSSEKAAETLLKAQPDIQKAFFRTMPMKKIAELLEKLPPDYAAGLLNMMPAVSNTRVLRLMKPGIAGRIQKILSYDKKSAAALMSSNFIYIPESITVGEAISQIRGSLANIRQIYYAYVAENDMVLKGAVSLRQLTIANSDDKISDIMRRDIIAVNSNTSMEDVLNLLGKYSLVALPVIDKDKKIIGVIRVNNILELMLPKRIKEQRIPRIQKRLKQNGNNGNRK